MATLNRAMLEAGIDLAGELPDHLSPVLRYLAIAPEPLPELLQILSPALKQIEHTLRTLEPANPYVGLLEATQEAVAAYVKARPPVLAGPGR
jgi:nitrate reductase delta subunit